MMLKPNPFSRCLSALVLLVVVACGTTETKKDDPSELMKEAEQEISNDHYLLALDKLREVKNKFPYSKHAVEAQLRLADVYFLQESFAEAAAAYESFRDLHPKHDKVAHALFRVGKSLMKDAPEEPARDQASSERALTAYMEFLSRFPSDPMASEARTDQSVLEQRLAEKELQVGEFYRKRGNLAAARRRFERVTTRFSKTPAAIRAQSLLEKSQGAK